jgi:hypothetical protein
MESNYINCGIKRYKINEKLVKGGIYKAQELNGQPNMPVVIIKPFVKLFNSLDGHSMKSDSNYSKEIQMFEFVL